MNNKLKDVVREMRKEIPLAILFTSLIMAGDISEQIPGLF